MNFNELTDKDIDALIKTPKKVTNSTINWIENRGSLQKNYKLTSNNFIYTLYLRQNLFDKEHFSCGLSVLKPDNKKLTLLRYNGSNHPHGDIMYECHIHKATEQAIKEGKKPESHAIKTDRYFTLQGALYCLCQDANITGITDLKADKFI